MPPKIEPDSLEKLRRRRGQYRFKANEAFGAIQAHVRELQAVDPSTWEIWKIARLESEFTAVESRIDAYGEANLDVQCMGDPKDEDEDTGVVRDLQSNLLALEQEIRTLRHQCEALISNQATTSTGDTLNRQATHQFSRRINTSLKPSPLTMDISLATFHVWKQKFMDFYTSNNMEKFSVHEQRAQLRGCMDVGVIQTISQYLDVSEDEPVEDVLSKLQIHLAKSVNIVRRRHDFNTLQQKQGETFCDLYVRLKLVGSLAELEDISFDELLASRLIVAVNNQDLQRKLLCMDNPSLAQVKAKCESWEAGVANLAALQGKSVVHVDQVSTYKARKQNKQRGRSKSRGGGKPPSGGKPCTRCGFDEHLGLGCPAKDQKCTNCGKEGHFQECVMEREPEIQKTTGWTTKTHLTSVPQCQVYR